MLKNAIKKFNSMVLLLSMCLTSIMPGTSLPVQAATTYTVTFDAGAGYFKNNTGTTQYNKISVADSDGDGRVTVTYPFNIASQSYTATRPGYKLTSWSYATDTVGAGELNGHSFILKENRTYTAVWEGAEYNVTFQDVDGQSVGPAKTMRLGDPNDLSLGALGFSEEELGIQNSFIGWKYQKSDGTTVFFDGHTSTVHDFTDSNHEPIFEGPAVILQAADAESTSVTITFDSNEGTGTMTPQTFKYGATTKLFNNKFTKTNYKFTGWSTDPQDTIARYTDGQETTCNFGLEHNITLYAIWVPEKSQDTETYSVQFIQNVINTDAGNTKYANHAPDTMTATPKQYYNNNVAALSNALPYQQGFYVTGFHLVRLDAAGEIEKKSKSYNPGSKWSLNNKKILIESSDGKYTEKVSDYESADGCIYLLPDWTPITLKLAYAPNSGGTGKGPDPIEITVGTNAALSTNTFTSTTDKSFMGWSVDSTTNADHMYLGTSTADSNMVFPAGYQVRSNLNSDQTYELFTDPFTKYLDVKQWQSAFATSTYFSNGVLDLTNYTGYQIYAIWDNNTYTVHYDINTKLEGTSGGMADQKIKYGSQTALNPNTFAITGYTFKNWNTRADGSGQTYNDRQTVNNLAERNATVTLYAQWTKATVAKIPLTVEQKWDDKNNQDGLRPAKISYTINATADNTKLTAQDLGLDTLNYDVDSGTTKQLLAQAPRTFLKNGSFHTITYSITATAPSGYTSNIAYSNNANGVTATYTYVHTPSTKNFTVTIKISDSSNQDGKRPKNVAITLNGSDGSSNQVNITISGETTTYTFEHLPVYHNGTQITYTVAVGAADGYTSSVSNSTSASTVTLTHTPEVMSVNVKVQWKDDDNKAKLRPSTVNASFVSSSGTTTSVRLSESGGWAANIDRIPKYYQGGANNGSLSVSAVDNYAAQVSGSASSGFTVVMTLSALAKKQAEAKAAGDTTNTKDTKTKNATLAKTNERKEETRSITVRTIWNDNGTDYLRPLTMSITLYGSDGKKYDRVLTSTTGYSTMFNDLPIKDAITDKEVEYKIGYSPIKGYTTHVYHNRKNPNEFIMEHFLPSNDKSSVISDLFGTGTGSDIAGTLTNGGMLGTKTDLTGNASKKDPGDLIVIGGKSEDDTLYANEDGTLREADTDLTKDPEKKDAQEMLYNLPYKKYLVPGAIIGGILAMIIALIVFFTSKK